MRSVTLADVAARAGVSGKTVSRVVNGEPGVSNAVRDRVNAAVGALGYRPNLAARSLASARSFAIGVVSRFDNGYFHSVHAHLASACRRHGYHLIVEQLADVDRPEDAIIGLLSEVPLAGIIFTPGVTPSEAVVEFATRAGMKTVVFAGPRGPNVFGAVAADVGRGEVELADHLWALGHRSFAILRLPDDVETTRGQDFQRHLGSLGLAQAAFRIVELDVRLPGVEAGRRAAQELLDHGPLPTALFAFDDDVAAGAIGVLLSGGVKIPDDISVVGFNDGEIARAIWPALTTVRQPIGRMADDAVRMIALDIPAQSREILCPVELVVRSSTGPADNRGGTLARSPSPRARLIGPRRP